MIFSDFLIFSINPVELNFNVLFYSTKIFTLELNYIICLYFSYVILSNYLSLAFKF